MDYGDYVTACSATRQDKVTGIVVCRLPHGVGVLPININGTLGKLQRCHRRGARVIDLYQCNQTHEMPKLSKAIRATLMSVRAKLEKDWSIDALIEADLASTEDEWVLKAKAEYRIPPHLRGGGLVAGCFECGKRR